MDSNKQLALYCPPSSRLERSLLKILGIETSCDETGIAIYDSHSGLLAHCLHSQVALHAEYGGVVPELASRDHIHKILPLIDSCFQQAKLSHLDLDGIAYTFGPGLVGPLMIGAALAKSLAFAWQLPSLPIHHLEGHLLSPFLDTHVPQFPFIALLVSGGHTLLYEVKALGDYTLLGETIDDAAGEAFDKTAKCLGLPYPGGKFLAELAKQGYPLFKLPVPLLSKDSLDFSFSGLKTAARLLIEKTLPAEISPSATPSIQADIAASFEAVIVETLTQKAMRALRLTGVKQLVVCGGVSANLNLRTRLKKETEKVGAEVIYPRLEFCTDNGAMIALAGALRFEAKKTTSLNIEVLSRSSLH